MKDKSSTMMKGVGIVLVIAIIALVVLIIYKKKEVEYIDKMMDEQYGTEKKTKEKEETKEEVSVDLTSSINTKDIVYKNASFYPSLDYGMAVTANNTQTVSISIDWSKLTPIINEYVEDSYPTMKKTYNVELDKTVKKVFIGEINHQKTGIALFFLMEDGTVEYWKVIQQTLSEDATIRYEKNFTEQDNQLSLLNVKEVPNVSDIVEFYNVENSNNQYTILGFKINGSFYDLGYEINK